MVRHGSFSVWVAWSLLAASCARSTATEGSGAGGQTATGGQPGAGGQSGAFAGAAGAGGGSGGAGGSGGQAPTGLLCPPAGATCTEAEWNAYTACVADACDGQYRQC